VVSQVQGRKPGRGNANRSTAFKGQSFPNAYGYFNAQAADIDARRSDDLHRLKSGCLVFGQQHDRASLIELGPPDFAGLHVSSW
jgi:hypothetical protein